MKLEDTKLTAEVTTTRELNKYLGAGWVLILSYVKHLSDSQQSRFIVAWQNEQEAVFPELLDEWELHEIERQMNL
ncbi:MAG: hypothetical protein LH472_16540 [Pyrinomonadaceae bacterium]|nr:hypothetical protein [Pyrinomonadaceae bacterium]